MLVIFCEIIEFTLINRYIAELRNKVMNLENDSSNKSIAAKYTLEKTANAILFDSGNVADSLDKINQIINGENVVFGKQDVFSLILSNFNVIKSSKMISPKARMFLECMCCDIACRVIKANPDV